MSRAIIIISFIFAVLFPLPVLGDSEVQVNGILSLSPGSYILFPDGTTQSTSIPAVHTSAVCSNASISANGDCSCTGTYVSHVRTNTSCTVTSDTGTCTATGSPAHYAECCICKP
jgi:hypothetical protein